MRAKIAIIAVLLGSVSTLAEDVMIVAHRGASKAAPENTLPAFRLAWEQGADAIEGDFHLTKDGQVVCIHDGNTKKYTDQALVVRNSTLADLRQLDVGVRKGEQFKGTVIPTIAEVFATVPEDKLIYVEIKCGPEIIPTLLEEIDKSGLQKEQIVVISFSKEVIRQVKQAAPELTASWLSHMRKKSGAISPTIEEALATLAEIDADGFSSAKNHVDEAYVKRIQAEGYDYHVWTVDDAPTARRFLQWGAKSITTNVPGSIREKLLEDDESPDQSD